MPESTKIPNNVAPPKLTAFFTPSECAKTQSHGETAAPDLRAQRYKTYQVADASVHALKSILDALESQGHAYVVTGQPLSGASSGDVVLARQYSKKLPPTTIACSKRCLVHPASGLVILVIDFDRNGVTDYRFAQGDDLIPALRQVGALHKVPMLSAYSGSTGVRRVDEQPAEPAVNRVYLPLWLRAGDSAAQVVRIIDKLLVLYGHGAARVAGNGDVSVDCIDTRLNTPWQPEILCQTIPGEGFVADGRPSRFVDVPGDAVAFADSADFPELDVVEQTEYEAVCRGLREAVEREAARVRCDYRQALFEKQREDNPQLSVEQCEQRVAGQIAGVLTLDYTLQIGARGARVSIEEILDSPEEYNGVSFEHSLLEPGYRRSATVYANLVGKWPHFRSHAHGGQLYQFEGYEREPVL